MKCADIAQIVSAIGTMIAAIVAVIAANQSYRSAKQNNETNEQMIRPRVVVYADNSKNDVDLIDLVVYNEGGGVARDIQLRLKGDDITMSYQGVAKNNKLSELDIIKKGIKIMPARSAYRYFIISTIGQVDKILAKNSEIEVSYTDLKRKKSYSDNFKLDFTGLPNLRVTKSREMRQKELVGEIKKIREALEKK